ncbi:helix-turn-helix domain-containing protein [Zophobihabitans entericus]|uniref:Helix-turn-helix domain-containing protein n=1 Tax=Zophobihabitans entericus TaxID=1635327 RepID=A0A6G9IE72_9GAMM|nr:helix-turn-helix domain-containing protein [Zophobihabitans entericus]QIQ22541.1 helix-turn-helix domain-containing protein [Zophobihabitans entericus]
MYSEIFLFNLLKKLKDRNLNKAQLSELSGISPSFISELTNGRANPSLAMLEKIAVSLKTPLYEMLLPEEVKPEDLQYSRPESLPDGVVKITAILPAHKAFIVKKWEEETKKQRKK